MYIFQFINVFVVLVDITQLGELFHILNILLQRKISVGRILHHISEVSYHVL